MDHTALVHPPLIAKTLQVGERRHWQRSGFLERQLFRLPNQGCSEAHAYSARAPRHVPKTESAGLNRVTFLPTTSTWPATS
jgi:hypothetical protein